MFFLPERPFIKIVFGITISIQRFQLFYNLMTVIITPLAGAVSGSRRGINQRNVVFGPNEYHKGRMASVIFHAFYQSRETGKVRLFRSHRPDFKDGEQLRDFVYVKDLAEVIWFLMNYRQASGLYNLGTGKARTFLDLAKAAFVAMDREPMIEFIDTPEDIRNKYQYFTEANMKKLRAAGYDKPFTSLEAGVDDYVRRYLSKGKYL